MTRKFNRVCAVVRNVFTQNIIMLRAAVHELSWSQRKKTPTKTIQSVATADSDNDNDDGKDSISNNSNN